MSRNRNVFSISNTTVGRVAAFIPGTVMNAAFRSLALAITAVIVVLCCVQTIQAQEVLASNAPVSTVDEMPAPNPPTNQPQVMISGRPAMLAFETLTCVPGASYEFTESICIDFYLPEAMCVRVDLFCKDGTSEPGSCGVWFAGPTQPQPNVHLLNGCLHDAQIKELTNQHVMLEPGLTTICLDACPGSTATISCESVAPPCP